MTGQGSISGFMAQTLQKLSARETKIPEYPISRSQLIERSRCPLCNSARTSQISEVYLRRQLRFFATAACDDCLFVYRNVFPSITWFQERWRQIASGSLEVFNKDLEAVRAARYHEYLSILSRHRSEGRLLEIGAGFGTGAKIFADAGFKVEALEPEDDRAAYIEKVQGIPVHGVALEQFDAPDQSYDMVVCAHNLEHVDDPRAQITRMRKWITADGLMYCEVPLVWTIVDFNDSMFLAHKSNFAESNFARLAKAAGFNCIAVNYPRLNTPHAHDLGVLMSRTRGGETPSGWVAMEQKDSHHSIDEIRTAYRRGAVANIPLSEVIRISVPRITHFFYTIRHHTGRFMDRRDTNGFIEFEE